MYIQEPPFAIQIELIEGCNLYCNFCGLQGIRKKTDKTYKQMSSETARSIAKQIQKAKWNSRIEFAMHGEPTMHSEYVHMVRVFRDRLPKNQLMMTSNGGGLLPDVMENLTELFKAGLNVFAFDAYDYVKIKDKVDDALSVLSEWKPATYPADQFEVHRYPKERKFSPHNRYGHEAKVFIRIKDISVATKGTHSVLNNHCGAGSEPLKKSIIARCAKPFRELSIRWDGSVAICCNDWRGVFKVGDVVTDGLTNVWNSEKLNSARRFLIRGDRAALSPCDVCDAKSYRVGLLPDKFGKLRLREPNEVDRHNVRDAAKGPTYTEPVPRPWELVQIENSK